MTSAKIAISLDPKVVTKLDLLVRNGVFPSRSRAIQEALEERLSRIDRTRLAKECSKLDTTFEKALAEEGFEKEVEQWPEY